MDKPKCRLCGEKHYSTEDHVFKDEARNQPKVTKPRNDVTPVTTKVTPVTATPVAAVTPKTGLKIKPHCPTCTCQRRLTHAERQRAYRERKAN